LSNKLRNFAGQAMRGSFIIFQGQLLSTGISVVGSILVARFLGSTRYGQMAVVLIPISFIGLFRFWGVNTALKKYIAQYQNEHKDANVQILMHVGLLFESAIGISLSLIAFLLAGFVSGTIFNQPELELLIQVSSITILAQCLLEFVQSIFIGSEKMELYSLTQIIFSLLKTFLAPILVFMGYGVFGAVIGYTAPLIIISLIALVIFFIKFWKKSNHLEEATLTYRSSLLLLLRYGIPLFFSNIIRFSSTQIENFIIAFSVQNIIFGNYKVATNFSIILSLVTISISTVLFPTFSKLSYEKDGKDLLSVFQGSVKYTALITLPLSAMIIVLSQPLVQLIYGDTYQSAPLFLSIYMIPLLLSSGFGALSVTRFLEGQGKTKILLIFNIINLATMLPLYFLLIPRFGIMGLLSSKIILTIKGLVVVLWWVKKNLNFTINWISLAKIFISTGLSFVFTFIFYHFINLASWITVLLGGSIFLLTYIVTISLIGAIEKNEIQYLKQITSTLGSFTPFVNFILKIIEKLTRN